MKSISKRITAHEADFTKRAYKLGLCPRIISLQSLDNYHYLLSLERYPRTLSELPRREREKYYPAIAELLNRLHSSRILHGDVSDENIVLSEDGETVKLIGFGMAGEINICSKPWKEIERARSICGLCNYSYSDDD